MELCSKSVFHFCREIHKIEFVSDYKLSKSRVCEVVAEGGVVSSDDGKFGTNRIMILRELTREEIKKIQHLQQRKLEQRKLEQRRLQQRKLEQWKPQQWLL